MCRFVDAEAMDVAISAWLWIAIDLNRPLLEVNNPILLDSDFGVQLRLLAAVEVKARLCNLNQQENIRSRRVAVGIILVLHPDDVRLGLAIRAKERQRILDSDCDRLLVRAPKAPSVQTINGIGVNGADGIHLRSSPRINSIRRRLGPSNTPVATICSYSASESFATAVISNPLQVEPELVLHAIISARKHSETAIRRIAREQATLSSAPRELSAGGRVGCR